MAGTARFEVFQEESTTRSRFLRQPARWYWRLRAANGEVLCRSSEGYRDKTDAKRGCTDAAHAVAEVTEIRVLDEEGT